MSNSNKTNAAMQAKQRRCHTSMLMKHFTKKVVNYSPEEAPS